MTLKTIGLLAILVAAGSGYNVGSVAAPSRSNFIGRVSDYYPSAALAAGLDGNVNLECDRNADGSLKNCVVDVDAPADHGFGKAAIAVALHPADYGNPPALPGTGREYIMIRFDHSGPAIQFGMSRIYSILRGEAARALAQERNIPEPNSVVLESSGKEWAPEAWTQFYRAPTKLGLTGLCVTVSFFEIMWLAPPSINPNPKWSSPQSKSYYHVEGNANVLRSPRCPQDLSRYFSAESDELAANAVSLLQTSQAVISEKSESNAICPGQPTDWVCVKNPAAAIKSLKSSEITSVTGTPSNVVLTFRRNFTPYSANPALTGWGEWRLQLGRDNTPPVLEFHSLINSVL